MKASVLFQKSERKPIISPKLNLATTYSLKNLLGNFGVQSRGGRNSDRSSKANQDAYFALPSFMQLGNVHLFGVADGHGPYGRSISAKVAEVLPNSLRCLAAKCVLTHKRHAVFRKLLAEEVFARTQADIVLECKEDARDSGATATMVLVAGGLLLCANVGDSRAVLCSEDCGTWEAAQISVDHRPEAERERIVRAGGVVDACRGMGFEAVDGEGKPYGPARVWTEDHASLGIAMSRSMGDTEGIPAGIISTPDVIEKTLKREDKIVIIASDGVWEVLTNEEAMDIVKEFYGRGEAEEAAKELVRIAAKEWRKTGNSIDDITAVVIFFNNSLHA